MPDYPTICNWLVQVPSGNPEPDEPADLWTEVECGATVRPHPDYPDAPLGDALLCDAGHRRLTGRLEFAPWGPAYQDETRDRYAETGSIF